MFTLFTDGGARGNPGNAACAAFLFDDKGALVAFDSQYLKQTTNNQAEYNGLLIGLKLALKHGVTQLQVKMDSELIIKQLLGEYKVKEEGMQKMFAKVQIELDKLDGHAFKHVPRAENKFADRLVNIVLDTVEGK
jgi:ribonuclease HI